MDSMMNRLQQSRFYLALVGFFLAAMVAGIFYFIVGMTDNTYLVSDGVRLNLQYLDKPRYDANLQGLIFAISFLAAGILLLLLIVLPDERQAAGGMPSRRAAPPQPARRRTTAPAQEPGPEAAPQVEEPPPTEEPVEPEGAAQTSPLTIEQADDLAAEAPAPAPGISLEQELKQTPSEDLPRLETPLQRFEDDDEDVVYGEGLITEDAAWDFVQNYPDSAVKFLYRKNLDNKPLTPTDEDIYRKWETRGLTRAKVREIVLEIMNWPSLPDAFPHQIWKEMRDQIYEIQTQH